jgi:penicillin-binding protein 1A
VARRFGLRRTRKPMTPWRWVVHGILWVLVIGLVFSGTFVAGLLAAPFPSDATVQESGTVTLVDASGHKFATLSPPESRTPISSLSQVAPIFIQAITAAEDKTFFSSSGVDPLAIVRSAWNDVTGGELQGGSTITQQYVKKVYTGDERTALRKIREAALAVRLEQHKSKQEILRLYLNTVYFGSGNYGIEAAALGYFGKHASELTLAQASLLAGVVPAPSAYSPRVSWEKAHDRQNYVLQQMVKDNDISAQDAAAAYAASSPSMLVAPTSSRSSTVAPEFTDEIARQLAQEPALGTDIFSRGPITVTTTLDLDLQNAMKKAVNDQLALYKGTNIPTPEAASVAIDPRNGDIKALYTSPTGGYKRGGYDVALQAERTSGSTVKPFTLAAALASGKYSLNTYEYGQGGKVTIKDVPGCSPWTFQNDDSSGGSYDLAQALAFSVNTIYGPLALNVGLTNVRDIASKAGIPTKDATASSPGIGFDGAGTGCEVYPSHGLGISVTPINLASGYATIANHGVAESQTWLGAIKTTGADPTTIVPAPKTTTQRAMTTDVASQVISAMHDVVTLRGATGTGALNYSVPQYLFGKTGTVDDETDGWFVGCNPTLCIATWMGYDRTTKADGKTPNTVLTPGGAPLFGGTVPATIYNQTIGNYATARLAKHETALPAGADVVPPAIPYKYVPTPKQTYGQTYVPVYVPAPAASAKGKAPKKGTSSTKTSKAPSKATPTKK